MFATESELSTVDHSPGVPHHAPSVWFKKSQAPQDEEETDISPVVSVSAVWVIVMVAMADSASRRLQASSKHSKDRFFATQFAENWANKGKPSLPKQKDTK